MSGCKELVVVEKGGGKECRRFRSQNHRQPCATCVPSGSRLQDFPRSIHSQSWRSGTLNADSLVSPVSSSLTRLSHI